MWSNIRIALSILYGSPTQEWRWWNFTNNSVLKFGYLCEIKTSWAYDRSKKKKLISWQYSQYLYQLHKTIYLRKRANLTKVPSIHILRLVRHFSPQNPYNTSSEMVEGLIQCLVVGSQSSWSTKALWHQWVGCNACTSCGTAQYARTTL